MQEPGVKLPPFFTKATADSSESASSITGYGDSSARVDETSQDEVSGESELSSDEVSIRNNHLRLLGRRLDLDEINEIKTTPIFSEAVRKYALSLVGTSKEIPFSQYGLLAGDLSGGAEEGSSDPRIFWNIAAPSSFFICGSQGSGKSHTLSCLLENALAPCKANVLPRPLTGIVFHYDTFISDSGGSPCEVAWLSSNTDIKVRVLCPPTNIRTMRNLYARFPNVKVEELRLNESDLNTKRMLDLMAVTTGGNLPLYLHVVQRILRDMRIVQQRTGSGFDYSEFKKQLQAEDLTDAQLSPLKQRLETLESFMVEKQAKAYDMFAAPQRGGGGGGGGSSSSNTNNNKNRGHKPAARSKGTSWAPQSSVLTVVDLSCPCVTPEMACSLFHICLSLFLEQDAAAVGRVVALDEAHKYMTAGSAECLALTDALLATIRLQRHLGARVLVSTQEPTVSPKLLDLCTVTVVHRFTSPDWLGALRRHLAGVSSGSRLLEKAERLRNAGRAEGDGEERVEGAGALTLGDADPGLELFSRIVDLRVGEALLFAPSAVVGVKKRKAGDARLGGDVKRLAHGVLKVRIRNRTTEDGGASIMAA
ncbi:Zona occludens toxin N-terminal domain-containing protein [Madurella fahalii]|uniref:Zona occludens toxin N-terminal domain-containing protein n=1 Tax=Madurella fahalii TaxID=1157608 RepID=A0ABQ0G3P8_9PEZI